MTHRHGIQCITNMQTADRACRTLQLAFTAAREGNDRAVKLFLYPGCQDTDDALVPVRIKQTQADG